MKNRKRKREGTGYEAPEEDVTIDVVYDESDSQLESQPFGSQPFGSQESSVQSPGSPFFFNFDQSPVSPPVSPSYSQSPSGSQLSQDDYTIVLSSLDEFVGESLMKIETQVRPHLDQYTEALKGHNEASIQAALKIPSSPEPVTRSPITSQGQVGDPDAPVSRTTRDEIVVEEVREEVGVVADVEEVAEVALDEGTSLYIGKAAEKIFDEALKEFLDDEIQEAADGLPDVEYSPQDLRMEILYDPEFEKEMAKVKGQNLEDLKSEIWRLLQQEDTSVEG